MAFKKPDQPPNILDYRCGACMFYINKRDSDNPTDGTCHGLPPTPTSTKYIWARTASNEFGCSLFRRRDRIEEKEQ